MALNRARARCEQVTLPVPEGTVAGQPLFVGTLRGVAVTDRDDEGQATLQLDGSWFFDVAQALTIGDAVPGSAIGIEGETRPWGHSLTELGDEGGVAEVRLDQSFGAAE